MKKIYLYVIISLLACDAAMSQDVAGNWYGVGIVKRAGEESNYLSELILKQSGNQVWGEFNYYFKSLTIRTTVMGRFNVNTRELEIYAKPVLNYMAKDYNGADCPMEGSFTLVVAKVQSTLTGWFNPTEEYKYTCRPIYVKFVKDMTEHADMVKTYKRPKPDTSVAQVETPPAPKKLEVPELSPKEVEERERVKQLTKRSFDASPVLDVDADTVTIDLYDNGEIDNDTISLFYNRKPLIVKQGLTATPFTVKVPVDSSVNEISMFAENLGRIPPNTAVAVVYVNGQRHELFLTSTYIKNATMRFKRKSKKG